VTEVAPADDGGRLQAVRRFYASYASGDLDALRASLAPDVVIHVGGSGAVAGTYQGRAGMDAFLEIVAAHALDASAEVEDVAVGEVLIFAREILTARRFDSPGETWTIPLIAQFRVTGGLISEVRITPENAERYSALYAPLRSDQTGSHA
jgi:ketosteroid isomerase-like protein